MKVKTLNQTHPEYDATRLAQHEALYSGGEPWRALVGTWLPKHPEEMQDTYEARLLRALYENHAGAIIDTLASAVFSEEPTIDGLDGEWVEAFRGNVDGNGATLGPWFREVLVELLKHRVAHVWVNLPARGEVQVESRRDEEALGLLDAFLVSLKAESVIDWRVDARGRLQWLIFNDIVDDRVSIETARTKIHRWTFIDATVIRRWTWSSETRDTPTDEDEAIEEPPVAHGLGEIPVRRFELKEGLHAMGKLRDPAVAHIRARNDLSWALHRAAHALLVLKIADDAVRPVLGPGYYLSIRPDEDAMYVEPEGRNFELLRDDLKDLREELYRVVQQMAIGADSNATRTKMSGESKRSDWQALEIVLGALAAQMRNAISQVLRLVMAARREPVSEPPEVTGLDDWDEEDLEGWLASAAMATDAHRLSPTFTRAVALRQAQRVLKDSDPEVLQEIADEIEAAEVDPAPYLPPPMQVPADTADSKEPADPED